MLLLCALLLIGDLGWSLRERSVQELFKVHLLRFSQDATLLNVLIGAMPALIALSMGPVIGAWSDRTRSRYGRRIPFLLGTTIVSASGMLGMAFSSSLLALAVSWTVFEIATIVGNPLFIALINDTVPRPILGRFFGLFRIVSLATGASFFALFFRNEMMAAFQPLLAAITAVYLGCMLLVCWRVREPDYGRPPARASLAPLRPGDRRWGLLFGAVALGAVAVLPININALNACVQFGVDAGSFGAAVASTYVISILLAWPLGWLADRYHPLRVGMAVMMLYTVCMLAAWRLVDGRTGFLVALIVHGVLAGCFLTGTVSLLPALLPRERFSQLAAVSASLTALLVVVSTLALGALLDLNGRDYRLLYLAAGVTSCCAVVLWSSLLQRHLQSGVSSANRTRALP
ncbi:MFS transporter [Duganella callida]|uniref:MFS transporter n=1 Tax=Duganella callida TaxID=2561932 RepID=A0A4Y9SJL5_9BURK|nr:MFS transporter [Duganella callida]TFW22606.1 MFS transporter [Duganella callida]